MKGCQLDVQMRLKMLALCKYGEFDVGVTKVPMSLHAWSWSMTRCLCS